jgi:hypothetical protein
LPPMCCGGPAYPNLHEPNRIPMLFEAFRRPSAEAARLVGRSIPNKKSRGIIAARFPVPVQA